MQQQQQEPAPPRLPQGKRIPLSKLREMMQFSEREKRWNIRTNLIEMMTTVRGYAQTEASILSREAFFKLPDDQQMNEMIMTFQHPLKGTAATIYQPEIKLDYMKKFFGGLEEGKRTISRVILVATKNPNFHMKSFGQHSVVNIEHWLSAQLIRNCIRTHCWQPKAMRVLSLEEQEAVKRKYGGKLHRLLSDSILARYWGAEVGDIMEIIRHSLTTGLCKTYRIVVPRPAPQQNAPKKPIARKPTKDAPNAAVESKEAKYEEGEEEEVSIADIQQLVGSPPAQPRRRARRRTSLKETKTHVVEQEDVNLPVNPTLSLEGDEAPEEAPEDDESPDARFDEEDDDDDVYVNDAQDDMDNEMDVDPDVSNEQDD